MFYKLSPYIVFAFIIVLAVVVDVAVVAYVSTLAP